MLKKSMDQTTTPIELPSHLWGQDPSFWVHCKLPLCRVHSCPSYTDFPDVLNINGHPVVRIETVGIVTSIISKPDRVIFEIDDGTARISCVLWRNCTFEKTLDRLSAQAIDAGKDSTLYRHPELSDLVCVQGKLSTYYFTRQVIIKSIVKQLDPNAESLHILHCVTLWKSVYSHPPQISDKP